MTERILKIITYMKKLKINGSQENTRGEYNKKKPLNLENFSKN